MPLKLYSNLTPRFEEEPKAKAEVAFTKPKIDVKHLMAKCRDEQCADNELADSTDDVDNSLLKEEKVIIFAFSCFTILFIIPRTVLLSSIQLEAETLDFLTHALPRNL